MVLALVLLLTLPGDGYPMFMKIKNLIRRRRMGLSIRKILALVLLLTLPGDGYKLFN